MGCWKLEKSGKVEERKKGIERNGTKTCYFKIQKKVSRIGADGKDRRRLWETEVTKRIIQVTKKSEMVRWIGTTEKGSGEGSGELK